MGDWYDENIEEGVRDVVRALRDNGFNTVSSCHHDMSVQMQYLLDGDVKRLHDLVWCHLHERGLPVTFDILVSHSVIDGRHYTFMTLRLPPGGHGQSAKKRVGTQAEESSGNVFADLGLPDPERRLAVAEAMRARRVGPRAKRTRDARQHGL